MSRSFLNSGTLIVKKEDQGKGYKSKFEQETVETEFTKKQRRKISSLASRFPKDFLTLRLAYGFLSQNPRFFLQFTNIRPVLKFKSDRYIS